MSNRNISKELQVLAWLSLPVLSSKEVENTASLLATIDFQRLESLITQHRTHPCVYHNIRQYFIEQIPNQLLSQVKDKYTTDLICRIMVKTYLQGLDNPKYTNSYLFNIKSHFFEITAFKNINYKITMLAKKFLPSENDVLTLKHLSTPWLFLYYPLRPFLAFKRKFFTK